MLDGEPMEVWYPAKPGAADGLANATYDMREWLPAEASALISDDESPLFDMDAVRDLPVAQTGPFAVVLFSHGMGGYRMQSSVMTDKNGAGISEAYICSIAWLPRILISTK